MSLGEDKTRPSFGSDTNASLLAKSARLAAKNAQTSRSNRLWSKARSIAGMHWVAVFASFILVMNLILLFVVQFAVRTTGADGFPALQL